MCVEAAGAHRDLYMEAGKGESAEEERREKEDGRTVLGLDSDTREPGSGQGASVQSRLGLMDAGGSCFCATAAFPHR